MPKKNSDPTPIELTPKAEWTPAKQCYDVHVGYLTLAKGWPKHQHGVIFCYCAKCLKERGDPYGHDQHYAVLSAWAKKLVELYPCMADDPKLKALLRGGR